jgi:hypoxanthine phosphoribosyltransferase
MQNYEIYANAYILFGIFLVILRQNIKIQIMSIVKIKDLTFKTFIPEEEIQKHVKEVADKINHDMAGKNPLFLAVLNGSFIFAADLMRYVTIPSEISFVKLASYEGTSSTGDVREVIGLNVDLKGRTVVIVEDIIDTGRTMESMIATLKEKNPDSIRICTLLVKPGKLQASLNIDYTAMSIPNDFIVGYGLDYDQQGRNLRDIYTLVSEK